MRVFAALAIFLLAFSVRLLTWHDTRFEVGKVQSVVVSDYQRIADLLRQEGVRGFFSLSSPLANLNNLGHPPGYSIIIALTQSALGKADSRIQFVQIIADSFAAVLILLIAGEVFSLVPATIAGAMAAVSPQLAWNSVLLLPDSLAVVPILVAVYLLARSRHTPRLITFVIVGALVGISCWLRANALLLSIFLAAAVLLLHGREQWRLALTVVAGTLLIILPLTIRNAVVFHRFIPLSLGSGQTLLEGIADYDTSGRFGIPNTDMGIMRQEAEMYQRPDYYGMLFQPDGVERERARLKRGARVIASHPLWFASAMTQRAAMMTRLERTRLISTTTAVSHSLDLTKLQPIATMKPSDLATQCKAQLPPARLDHELTENALILRSGTSEAGTQFSCPTIQLHANSDYLLELPVRTDQGRMRIVIVDNAGHSCASQIAEPLEVKDPTVQPSQTIRLPFVSLSDAARIDFRNEAANAPPVLHLGEVRLYELGPARFLWTRYPRSLVHAIQRLFITAVFLPLALIGLGWTIWRRRAAALVILSVVPLYYFTVQSVFHTEYRYVLAVNYFLFAFAAAGTCCLAHFVRRLTKLRTE